MEILNSDDADVKMQEISILERYQNAVLEYNKREEQLMPSKHFRPSSLAGGCKRMLYYLRKGYEQEESSTEIEWQVNLAGITNTGTHRHEVIQDILKEMKGVRYLEEEEIKELIKNTATEIVHRDREEYRFKNDKLKIYFQPDGILEIDGEVALLEIKTTSIFNWGKLEEPMEKHIEQANIYAKGLGLDKILFMYEDRNFTRMKIYLIDADKEVQKAVWERVDKVEEYITKGEIPPKELDKCQYCRFKQRCKGDK